MLQRQVFLKGRGKGLEGTFPFIIFTFRDWFPTSSSTAGQGAADINSQRLVRPAADDDFVKLLYSLQNCVRYLKKNYFLLPPELHEKSQSKLSKNEPENMPWIKITWCVCNGASENQKLTFDRKRPLNW